MLHSFLLLYADWKKSEQLFLPLALLLCHLVTGGLHNFSNEVQFPVLSSLSLSLSYFSLFFLSLPLSNTALNPTLV